MDDVQELVGMLDKCPQSDAPTLEYDISNDPVIKSMQRELAELRLAVVMMGGRLPENGRGNK